MDQLARVRSFSLGRKTFLSFARDLRKRLVGFLNANRSLGPGDTIRGGSRRRANYCSRTMQIFIVRTDSRRAISLRAKCTAPRIDSFSGKAI